MMFLIVGRTGVGKDTYSKRFIEQDQKKLVSYTTRPKRKDDKDDTHVFIKKEEVDNYKKNMIAYSEINGNIYFTLKDDYEKADFMIIDPNGIKNIVKSLSKEETENLRILYLWAKRSVRKERTKDRTNYNFEKRDQSETKQFDEFEKVIENNKYYHGIKVVLIIFTDKSTKIERN